MLSENVGIASAAAAVRVFEGEDDGPSFKPFVTATAAATPVRELVLREVAEVTEEVSLTGPSFVLLRACDDEAEEPLLRTWRDDEEEGCEGTMPDARSR